MNDHQYIGFQVNKLFLMRRHYYCYAWPTGQLNWEVDWQERRGWSATDTGYDRAVIRWYGPWYTMKVRGSRCMDSHRQLLSQWLSEQRIGSLNNGCKVHGTSPARDEKSLHLNLARLNELHVLLSIYCFGPVTGWRTGFQTLFFRGRRNKYL